MLWMKFDLQLASVIYLICCIFWGNPVCHAQTVEIDSLRSAARRGNNPAAVLLSEYFHLGTHGIPMQPDSSNVYAKIAAVNGYAPGCYLWGTALIRGQSTPRNIKEGLKFLNQAANQNHVLAINMLTEVYTDTADYPFTDKQNRISPDLKIAFQYAKKGFELNDWRSTLYLGRAYRFGKGVAVNDSLALLYLDIAAQKMNQVEAQLLLGDFFLYGTDTYGIDLPKAEKYYTLAAQHPYAQIENVTWGKVGLHNIKQMPRRLFNIITRLSVLVPTEAMDVKFKK